MNSSLLLFCLDLEVTAELHRHLYSLKFILYFWDHIPEDHFPFGEDWSTVSQAFCLFIRNRSSSELGVWRSREHGGAQLRLRGQELHWWDTEVSLGCSLPTGHCVRAECTLTGSRHTLAGAEALSWEVSSFYLYFFQIYMCILCMWVCLHVWTHMYIYMGMHVFEHACINNATCLLWSLST